MSDAKPKPVLAHARLAGEKVLLRPLEMADVEPAFAMLHGREEILRWLIWDGPDAPEDMHWLYGSWVTPSDEGYNYHFAICDAATGEFAGTIGPRFKDHPGVGDLGYWLDPRCWGRGFMTEAVRLVDHLCFKHLESDGLYAHVFVGNAGSRKVLERNGYVFQRTVEKAAMKRGEPRDEWLLTLDRPTWRERFGDWSPRAEEVVLAGREPGC